MKPQTMLVAFYILYFSWLYVLTFINFQPTWIFFYSLGVIAFYFGFLNSRGDFFLFLGGIVFGTLISMNTIPNPVALTLIQRLSLLPIWVPISWGITMIALKRLISISSREPILE